MAFEFKAFLRRFQLQFVYNVLREAARRFPLSVACCAAGVVIGMLGAHGVKPFSEDMLARIALFLGYGVALFTAAKLCAEGSNATRGQTMALMAASFVLIAAAAFAPPHFTSAHVFLGAAIALSMLFAPYVMRSSTEDSVWYYNYTTDIALVIAGISTLVLCAGLSAIIGSLIYLFPRLDFMTPLFADIWIFGGFFFGPVAFMYQIPRQFDYAQSECAIPRGIYFIANYLAIPLLLIYTFMLYVYSAKIVVLWELPKGNLAYIVTGFGALGIAARLAVFPMRHNGIILLQQFYKYFFLLLLIPSALLAVGVYTRINDYGVTEERYAIALGLVWFVLLTAWYLLRPERAHIKQVPMLLAALFLLAATGPWGAVKLSTYSQVARLEKLLEKNGILKDGVPVKTAQEVAFKERKDISSILEYLYESRKEDAIAHWVEPFAKEMVDKNAKDEDYGCGRRSFTRCWWAGTRAEKLMKAWGMVFVNQYEHEESQSYISLRAPYIGGDADVFTRVAGYDYMTRVYAYMYGNNSEKWLSDRVFKEAGVEKFKLRFVMTQDGAFTITRMEGDLEGKKLSFELMPVIAQFGEQKSIEVKDGEEQKLVLRGEAGGMKAELRISDMQITKAAGKPVLHSAQMTLLITP